MTARLAITLALLAPVVAVVWAVAAMLDADPFMIGLLVSAIIAVTTWVFVFEPVWLDRRQPGDIALDEYECPSDFELPGMWERADFTGGIDEVRP